MVVTVWDAVDVCNGTPVGCGYSDLGVPVMNVQRVVE